MGVAASGRGIDADLAGALGLGWYVDWGAWISSYRSNQVEYVPMIRLRNGAPDPGGQALLDVIEALPGALWLIGNEPDVKWQDNVPPDPYAQLYHDLYHLLKTQDPSCQVAIGGITQPSPLRLKYLDQVLEAYQTRYGQPMPVDVWNIHNFVLREERDAWGVDIPPGMTEQSGLLVEVDDHDSLTLFEEQILRFRRWMKDRGQQHKPLIVTEYGILMPADYGFPPERVEAFMLKTFEFFRTAADPALGYPADDFRLVQRWCWYSLADRSYPTGNLLQIDTGELGSLGEAFRRYAHSQY
jgi:hypothetical protein